MDPSWVIASIILLLRKTPGNQTGHGEKMGVSKNRGSPKWMVKITENPIKMDDLGIPLFLETPRLCHSSLFLTTLNNCWFFGWLEYDCILFGWPVFRGYVSFWEGNTCLLGEKVQVWYRCSTHRIYVCGIFTYICWIFMVRVDIPTSYSRITSYHFFGNTWPQNDFKHH